MPGASSLVMSRMARPSIGIECAGLIRARLERIEMDDPTDPTDTAFQRLLNREILLSERRRMLILAGVQALILVLILLAATFAPELRPVDLS